MSQEYQATRVAFSSPSVVTVDELTTAPLAPSAFTSCCRVAHSRTFSSSPSCSLRARLRPLLVVAARVALSRLAAARHGRRPSLLRRAPTSTLPRLQSTSETVSSRSSGAPRPGRPSISSPMSRRRGQSRRRPSASAEGPPPAFPKPNRPYNDLLQGTVELSDLLPTAHGRWSITVAARVRRRPLCSVEPPPPSASAIPKTLQR